MTTNSPVTIAHDVLQLGPVQVSFQRTLRLPETGLHALPPGLVRFRLRRVADYPDTAPADWLERGVMLPVYQREPCGSRSSVQSRPRCRSRSARSHAISGTAWRGFATGTELCGPTAAANGRHQLRGRNHPRSSPLRFGSGATVAGQLSGEEIRGECSCGSA